MNNMNLVLNLLVAVQIISALVMIGLILIQHGKGADMGAAFGSGSAGSLFGASGSANFLSRMTAGLAVLFFGCTLALAYFGHSRDTGGGGSLLERSTSTVPPEPAKPIAPSNPQGDVPAPAATVAVPPTAAQMPIEKPAADASSPPAAAVPEKPADTAVQPTGTPSK